VKDGGLKLLQVIANILIQSFITAKYVHHVDGFLTNICRYRTMGQVLGKRTWKLFVKGSPQASWLSLMI